MKAYLFWKRKIKFQLAGDQVTPKKAEVALELKPADITAFTGGDASQNWHLLSKLQNFEKQAAAAEDKKSLKLIFSDMSPEAARRGSSNYNLNVRLEGRLPYEIWNILGSDVRIQLEISKAQVTSLNPSVLPAAMFLRGRARRPVPPWAQAARRYNGPFGMDFGLGGPPLLELERDDPEERNEPRREDRLVYDEIMRQGGLYEREVFGSGRQSSAELNCDNSTSELPLHLLKEGLESPKMAY